MLEMMMESKDIQSDLRALEQLYGLISNDRDETTNTELLDEHSRVVLKNLLDAATKKVLLKLQSEIEVDEASGTQEQSASRSVTAIMKTHGLDASLLKEKEEQSFPIVPAGESHKLCQSKNECDGYLENSKSSCDVDCHSTEELCISGLHIERGADQLHPFDNNCRLLCHAPTQRATDPILLLFQPANCIRSGMHFAIEDEQRHVQTYKPSSCMNMISNENGDQESDEETSRNDSEEYSLTGSSEAEYVNSSRSSGSWGTPRSRYSGEEVYSSSSRDEAPELSFSSSSRTSEGYSSYEEPTRIHGYAKRSGPKAYGVSHVKQSGMWNRLKERLSVIFHRHHRDHGDRRKMIHRYTLDKRREKVVDFKRPDETHWEKDVEKTRKSLVHQKRQHTHFHGLVQGLLRHVRHSKQAKTGKGNVGRHSRKKNLNKSHWWQLLQHHRGAKLHHHRKLGLGKEKSH